MGQENTFSFEVRRHFPAEEPLFLSGHQSKLTLKYSNTAMRRRPRQHKSTFYMHVCNNVFTLYVKCTITTTQSYVSHAYLHNLRDVQSLNLNNGAIKELKEAQVGSVMNGMSQSKLYLHLAMLFPRK